MPSPALVRLAALCLLAPALSSAAHLSVLVTDDAGKPLLDAVVMLEPANGKLPVKPLAQVEIAQRQRQFTPQLTVVTVGTPVSLPNFDTVRHHVYSFSPIKTFELKLYSGVPSKPIVFDKPGEAVLGCNIHDRMAAWVVVVDTPHYARTGADGRAQIDGIAAGSYRLRAWHAGVPAGKEPAPVALNVAAADLQAQLTLPVGTAP
ncbi:MAG TPA: methylamine utilization protein [Rhizobacter sp.]|nr:methylamine utilization protein [Rhizobacter sp.]